MLVEQIPIAERIGINDEITQVLASIKEYRIDTSSACFEVVHYSIFSAG
jgi:hypothetical protein